jgi:hypothetical protein
MPNSIKYSTTGDTLSLKKGNFFIGTGDVGKGPTSATTYWNGITPPSGGYSIYKNKALNGPAIWTASTNNQLISITNNIEGTSFTSATQCFVYYANQTDRMIFNRDYESIITNGLILNLDAGFLPSYPTSGTTWYDLGYSGFNGTLTNGPTYSSANGGSILFDGSDDKIVGGNFSQGTIITINIWFKQTSSAVNKGLIAIGGAYYYLGGGGFPLLQIYNGSQYGAYIEVPSPTTWNMATFVITPTTSTLYLNGSNPTSDSTVMQTSGNLYIGSFPGGGSGLFNGNISTVQIYNRALSADEVAQNFNAYKTRFGL